jgi:undecaprenyl-diphosphatase
MYDLAKTWDKLQASDFGIFALGFAVAFVSAILAIKFFIHLLQRMTLSPFGVYRIVVALIFFWVVYQ